MAMAISRVYLPLLEVNIPLKIIHDQTYRKFEADLTVGLLTPPSILN